MTAVAESAADTSGASTAAVANKAATDEDIAESSREAGLLTDWHLEGCFGRDARDFAHRYAPEKEALKEAVAHPDALLPRHHRSAEKHYELVFPSGGFELTPAQAANRGVFYASSLTYLIGGGEWIVYLESSAPTEVFVDGRPVLRRGAEAGGVLRQAIHAESGYHMVLVKFLAQSAPFRVAILPPNSGSHHKNNTPYLRANPASEEMMARLAPYPPKSGR